MKYNYYVYLNKGVCALKDGKFVTITAISCNKIGYCYSNNILDRLELSGCDIDGIITLFPHQILLIQDLNTDI